MRYAAGVFRIEGQSRDGIVVAVSMDGRRRRPGQPVPDEFTATAHGGPLPYELELTVRLEDARLVCTDLQVHRVPRGQPITSAGLRMPLHAVVRGAAELLAGDTVVAAGGDIAVDWPSPAAARWAADAAQRPARRGRKPKSRARLEEVAAAWRAAKGQPNALSRAGASIFVSRSQFHRLLRDAVAAGYLRPHEVPTRPKGQS